jgi:hypothetical protein
MPNLLDALKARMVDSEIESLFDVYRMSSGLPETHFTRLSFYMTLAMMAEDELDSTSEYDKLFLTRIHHAYTLALATMVYAMFWPKK